MCMFVFMYVLEGVCVCVCVCEEVEEDICWGVHGGCICGCHGIQPIVFVALQAMCKDIIEMSS